MGQNYEDHKRQYRPQQCQNEPPLLRAQRAALAGAP
jgi:hypothetical protein